MLVLSIKKYIIHTYTYIHTHIYIHTYIHTYIQLLWYKKFLYHFPHANVPTHKKSYRYQVSEFCDVTPCTLVNMDHHIEGLRCLNFQGRTFTELHGVTSLHITSHHITPHHRTRSSEFVFVSQLFKNFLSSLGFLNTVMNECLICLFVSRSPHAAH